MTSNQWSLSFFLADFDLIGLFALSNFQIILTVISLIIAFLMIVWVAFIFAHKAEEKNRPLIEKTMSETASKFGKVISVDALRSGRNQTIFENVLSVDAMRFERNQTIFDAKIELLANVLASNSKETLFSVQFNLPNLQEKFFIQHRSVFSKYSNDCQPIPLSVAPKDFIFHSLNAQFLLSLLEKEKILAEIYNYPSDWLNRFRIAFENGVFIITWRKSGKWARNNPERLQRLEQICQTAVIFYDELLER